MAYTTIDNPELYFQTKLYTGNGSSRSITLDGSENMQPDWTWIKIRSQSYSNRIFDSVRGTGKFTYSDTNEAEGTNSATLSAFNTNGFSLGDDNSVNQNTDTYVSWNWKTGTSFSNDASATSVGSIDSSGSINTTAGQSIISWTGSGSGATIAHGLGIQPQIVFVKNRDDTASWNVYTVDGGGGKGLFLNENNGYDSDSSYFNGGTASTTTFPVGTANTANGSSDDMIAYCFGNVQGYSKIGAYTVTANSNRPFIFTGFKPAWLMIKKTNSGGSVNCYIFDNKRSPINAVDDFLKADTNDAEGGDGNAYIDFLSNGFKLKTGNIGTEASGTFVYIAFAESPFVNSNGVPNNAR